jgi:hypothetical protein
VLVAIHPRSSAYASRSLVESIIRDRDRALCTRARACERASDFGIADFARRFHSKRARVRDIRIGGVHRGAAMTFRATIPRRSLNYGRARASRLLNGISSREARSPETSFRKEENGIAARSCSSKRPGWRMEIIRKSEIVHISHR